MVAALTAGMWFLAGVALLCIAVRSRRHWGEPGAEPFTALAVTLGCAAFALGAVPFEPLAHLVALPLIYNALAVLWAVFFFQFTGRYDVGGTRRRLLLASPAVYQTFVYVGFTLAASRLTGEPVTTVQSDAWYAVVEAATGPLNPLLHVLYAASFVTLFFLIGLLIAATAVLMSQLVRYDHLGPRVAALLPISVVSPWVVVVTVTTASMGATFTTGPLRTVGALVFLAAAGGLALVTSRYDLFATAPAAGTVGPERVIQDLSEHIVVADHDERVIRLNPAARSVFGAEGEYVGSSVADLLGLSDRAREVEQMLSIPIVGGQTSHLATVVSTVVGEVAADYDVAVTVSVPEDVTVGVDARILQPIVHNLVVNAIRHHDREDPTIDVSATVGDGGLPVTLSVVDDGPGLPDHERVTVERGHENPLEHGSGLGLWAIKWGVTRIGGHLAIRDNEPRGTVVEISLPGFGSERGTTLPPATDSVVGESSLDAGSADATGRRRR